MGQLYLGCSGWSYKEWVGPFYKDHKESKLAAYSEIFNTTEINSTFYAYPKAGMVNGWAQFSPKDFVFSVKLPGQITHDKELKIEKKLEQDLNYFLQLMRPLTDTGKLGCYLIQLPPRLKFLASEVEDFYTILPEKHKFAVEFRNKTWLDKESIRLLEKYNLAYTIVDEPLLPPNIHITTNFAYLRWHGYGEMPWYNYRYKKGELEKWIPKIRELVENVETAYGYFNNHYSGYAPENCLEILEMLEVATSEQKIALEKIKSYREQPLETELKTKTLTEYMDNISIKPKEPKIEENTESLLRQFADEGRILRGRVIRDNELKDITFKEQKLLGKIRKYSILIDLKEKLIQHDCDDWQRIKNRKKFCKHIIKLLLRISKKESLKILKTVKENLNQWKFK
jgi:uncharacterized protein YecE (DUF72 family)